MSDEEDFEEQLEQEKIAKAEAENEESAHRGLTYTDDDGTVMEWDPQRKAYFPKVTNYPVVKDKEENKKQHCEINFEKQLHQQTIICLSMNDNCDVLKYF
jgi:hypothetical protein